MEVQAAANISDHFKLMQRIFHGKRSHSDQILEAHLVTSHLSKTFSMLGVLCLLSAGNTIVQNGTVEASGNLIITEFRCL